MPVHLDHINFTVADFRHSVDWYQRVFDFELVEETITDGMRWGVLRSGDAMLCLYERPGFEQLDRFAMAERKVHGMAHFALRVADAAAWENRAREQRVEILYRGVVHWPHSRSWYINDPTGYEIEVVCWDGDEISFAGCPVDSREGHSA